MNALRNIKLVIFDMDGLLFDTEIHFYQAIKKIMTEHGYDYNLDHYKKTMGYTGESANFMMRKMFGKDLNILSLSQEYNAKFQEYLKKEGVTLKRGAVKLLRFLKEENIATCIASSSTRATIKEYLTATGLEGYFSFYLGADNIKRKKPFPDIFLKACKMGDVSVNRTLVLEDSLNGLRASNAANIKCIMVPDLVSPDEEMRENAFNIVDDLEKVICMF